MHFYKALSLAFQAAWGKATARKFAGVASNLPAVGERQPADTVNSPYQQINRSTSNNPRMEKKIVCKFANEFPDIYEPPPELIEGLLSLDGGSVMYGDSNTGKTFLAIDMAASISRGAPWMGMRTQIGMVLYLAAESPASVRARLHAYQKHHGIKIANFAIVESPINLFDGEYDTDAIVKLIREIESSKKQKVVLVIGDTLSRLTAGANENAGQDMGLVIRRIDRVRSECKVHFCLVHHAGKIAAAGARGWSGVRAAVDTEIEIKSTSGSSVARVTKQRDLASKGQNFGFRLKAVEIGATLWAPVTSCVVLPDGISVRAITETLGEAETEILSYVKTSNASLLKKDVVKGLSLKFAHGTIYRSIQSLMKKSILMQSDDERLHVSSDFITASTPSKTNQKRQDHALG